MNNSVDDNYILDCFKNRNEKILLFVSILALIVTIILSVFIGAVKYSPIDMIENMFDVNTTIGKTFMYIRLPRALAALLAGSALAVAGVIIQNVLNNPLAGPNVIGVNSGAGLGAVVFLSFFPTLPSMVPIAAFLGALLTMLLIYFVAKRAGLTKLTIVLTGVAINSVISACTDALTTLYPDIIVGVNAFKIGGLSGITIDKLFPSWIIIIIVLVLTYVFHHELDILSLGDEVAKSLGMSVGKIKFKFLIFSALLAGSAVSFSGLLGFIGLLIPHLVRFFIGNESKGLIINSALLGASFLLFCDTLSRVIFRPYEIPVGIILSVIGGIFFISLLVRRKRT